MNDAKAGFITELFSLLGIHRGSNSKAQGDLTATELRERLGHPGTVILDVRTSAELHGALGKLLGAVNIPLHQLGRRMAELTAEKDKDIVVICQSGHRSGVAARMLQAKGFNARSLGGGMQAWRRQFGMTNG